MKEKKRDVKGWIAIGLAALSLFLVVYALWLGPVMKEQAAKAAKAAAEAKGKAGESAARVAQQEMWDSFFTSEEGEAEDDGSERKELTVADYIRGVEKAVIYRINNSQYVSDAIDSEEEKQSVKFYDCYVTNVKTNRETNEGYDLVVRCSFSYDDSDSDSMMSMYFKMDDYRYGYFLNIDRYYINTAEDFVDYLISNRESIYGNFTSIALKMTDNSINKRDGSLLYFTAEDFDAISDYVPNTEWSRPDP